MRKSSLGPGPNESKWNGEPCQTAFYVTTAGLLRNPVENTFGTIRRAKCDTDNPSSFQMFNRLLETTFYSESSSTSLSMSKKKKEKKHYTSQCCETWKSGFICKYPSLSFLNLTIQNYPQFKHNAVFYWLWNGLNCEVPSHIRSDFSHTQYSCACHRVQPCEFMQRVINFYHFIGLKKFRCTRQSPFIPPSLTSQSNWMAGTPWLKTGKRSKTTY